MQTLLLESGLYFDPPPSFFRFQDSAYFCDQFKRYGLCEMDFGWWDPAQRALILLELKDYSLGNLPLGLVDELAQKATDSLLLLGSVYYGLPHAEGIKADLPAECHGCPTSPDGLRLLFVLKVGPERAQELMSMRDKLINKLKGRLALLNLRGCTQVLLLDHATAASMGIPITDAGAEAAEQGRGGKGRRRR